MIIPHQPANHKNDTKILPVDQEVVEMANAVPTDPAGFSQDEKEFLEDVMQKIMAGTIDPLKPSSLINQPVYSKSEDLVKSKADLTAINLCSKLRQIQDLFQISGGDKMNITPSYQAKHMVMDLKYQKELFENEHGDIFLI
ncbi:hypothetical protein HOH51_03130 [bacterium]|jgi:hypothetical protein|nr:hypothetical protein [bacterium]